MKSKLLLSITAGLLFCSAEQKAQVSAYSFIQTSGTYGAANTGALVGPVVQDDDLTPVTLPFPFTYNGVAQTTIDVCSNGYLSFNPLTGTEYYAISDLGTQNVICPFGDDLQSGTIILADVAVGSNSLTNCTSVAGLSIGDVLEDQYGDFTANPTITNIIGSTIVLSLNALSTGTAYDFLFRNGYIKNSMSGTAPNRICEFEFANYTRYFINDERINFKVKLYETTNAIEFLYGTNVSGPAISAPEVGIKGNTNSDYNSRAVVSPANWNTSVASTSPGDYCEFDNVTYPVSGQSYMWTPPSCTVPVLAVTPASTVICEGTSVALTASGATSYSWANGPATAQYNVSPSVTTTYTLIGANNSCTTSIDYTVTVAASPTLGVSASSPAICSGESVMLTASGATSYTWTNGPSTAQYNVSPATTTTYTLTGSNGTCTSTFNHTQIVAPNPVLSVAASSTLICAGASATLTASGATSYSWNGTSAGATLNISPGTTTTYSLAGSNGTCTSTQNVTQNVAPNPTITISQPNAICPGMSATLTAAGADTYTWNGVAGTATLVVNPVLTTTYNVAAGNGTCTSEKSVVQIVSECTGINESATPVNNSILAYPNPFNTSFNLKNSSDEEQAIVITDGLGKVVYTAKISGNTTENIPAETLKRGLYFVSVKGSSGSYITKLIKE